MMHKKIHISIICNLKQIKCRKYFHFLFNDFLEHEKGDREGETIQYDSCQIKYKLNVLYQ